MTLRERWLSSAIFLCGAASALLFQLRLHFVAQVGDEWVYLFQADTFARGRLSLPAPALPVFFEAPQILVAPVYAAKYFPGHAALLAPFVALGVPWLWPCVSLGASSWLLYRLSRAAGLRPLGALLAAVFLFTSPPAVEVLATHLSQTSVTLLFLGALALLFSRAGALRAWLGAGAMTGFVLLVRPVDALALGLICGLAALKLGTPTHRRRLSRLLLLALPCLAALALFLLYDRRLTGSFLLDPWTLWARQYTPADGLGIGPPSRAAPLRAIPPQLEYLTRAYASLRARYLWPALGRAVLSRLRVWIEFIPSPFFIPAFALGLASLRAAPRLLWLWGLSALVFLFQLGFYASAPAYFCELIPALAATLGLGIDRLLSSWQAAGQHPRRALWLACAGGATVLLYGNYLGDLAPAPTALVLVAALAALVFSFSSLRRSPRFARTMLAGSAALFLAFGAWDTFQLDQWRRRQVDPGQCEPGPQEPIACRATNELRYQKLLAQVAQVHGLVFIAPSRVYDGMEYPRLNPGLGVSDPPLIRATDLGPARDEELRRLYPERPAFLLDDKLHLQRIGGGEPREGAVLGHASAVGRRGVE